MARFDLNYLPSRRSRSSLGWAIAVVGAVLLFDVSRLLVAAEDEFEALQRSGVSGPGMSAPLPGDSQGPKPSLQPVGLSRASEIVVTKESLARAEAVAKRLVVPWEALFQALEAVPARGVRLLAILPDPSRRSLSVSGEAKDYLAMLNYVNALGGAGRLTEVHVVRHEMRAQDPRFTVSFELQGAWADRAITPRTSSTSDGRPQP